MAFPLLLSHFTFCINGNRHGEIWDEMRIKVFPWNSSNKYLRLLRVSSSIHGVFKNGIFHERHRKVWKTKKPHTQKAIPHLWNSYTVFVAPHTDAVKFVSECSTSVGKGKEWQQQQQQQWKKKKTYVLEISHITFHRQSAPCVELEKMEKVGFYGIPL